MCVSMNTTVCFCQASLAVHHTRKGAQGIKAWLTHDSNWLRVSTTAWSWPLGSLWFPWPWLTLCFSSYHLICDSCWLVRNPSICSVNGYQTSHTKPPQWTLLPMNSSIPMSSVQGKFWDLTLHSVQKLGVGSGGLEMITTPIILWFMTGLNLNFLAKRVEQNQRKMMGVEGFTGYLEGLIWPRLITHVLWNLGSWMNTGYIYTLSEKHGCVLQTV